MTFSLLMCLIAVSGPVQSATSRAQPPAVHREEYFDISLPVGFVIERVDTKMDFLAFDVRHTASRRRFVTVYLGQDPQFPAEGLGARRTPSTTTMLEANGVTIQSAWRGNRLVGRDVLIQLHPPEEPVFPMFVHAWTDRSLDTEDVAVADPIVMSLKIRRGASVARIAAADFLRQVAPDVNWRTQTELNLDGDDALDQVLVGDNSSGAVIGVVRGAKSFVPFVLRLRRCGTQDERPCTDADRVEVVPEGVALPGMNSDRGQADVIAKGVQGFTLSPAGRRPFHFYLSNGEVKWWRDR